MQGLTPRRLRNLVILVLAVVAGATAIRTLTPEPYLRHVTPKTRHLGMNPDRYEILFAGSSRVYRQISPKVFDDELRARGIDLVSFNAGIPAAKSVEVWHFLKRLASESGVRARYVLIEPDGLLVGVNRENIDTEREIYWHGWTETVLAIRSLQGLPIVPRTRMSGLHLGAFFFNRLGVGRLRLFGSQLGDARQQRWSDREGLGPDGDGWVPFKKADTGAEFARRQEFLDDLPRYRRMLARQDERRSRPDCLTSYHSEMLVRLEAAVESLGATPIFILSPATDPRCEVHAAFRDGVLPNLIAFDDATEYPELYEVRHRFDIEHLNTEGALLYSRLLAERFAELVRINRERDES